MSLGGDKVGVGAAPWRGATLSSRETVQRGGGPLNRDKMVTGHVFRLEIEGKYRISPLWSSIDGTLDDMRRVGWRKLRFIGR